VLAGSIEDVVRPPVSITLPIHNKERHARRLAFNLYGSTRSYKNIEYIVLFDGCTDKSQERFASVSRLFARRKTRVIETPNIFEVRSNNLGLKASSGKYCVLLQDDNFLFDDLWVERCVAFLERHPKVGIVGGLAGVDYFPIGTDLRGRQGQTAMSASECYQRRDPRAEPHLAGTAYEVDACMRGPLVVRKSLLERFGYLDEAFAPLYCDDMDLCLRLQSHGYLTFCLPLAVRNEELTMARYDPERQRWVDSLVSRNAALLYARWSPFPDKDRRIRVVASQFAPLADSSPAARALRLLYVMAARWWGVHARGDYLPIARHFAQSVIRRAEVAGRS
jgi:GT2 family glycosyltransferase